MNSSKLLAAAALVVSLVALWLSIGNRVDNELRFTNDRGDELYLAPGEIRVKSYTSDIRIFEGVIAIDYKGKRGDEAKASLGAVSLSFEGDDALSSLGVYGLWIRRIRDGKEVGSPTQFRLPPEPPLDRGDDGAKPKEDVTSRSATTSP